MNSLQDKFGHTALLQQQYWQPAKTAERKDSSPATRPCNNPVLTVLRKGRTFSFPFQPQHQRRTGFFFLHACRKLVLVMKKKVVLLGAKVKHIHFEPTYDGDHFSASPIKATGRSCVFIYANTTFFKSEC